MPHKEPRRKTACGMFRQLPPVFLFWIKFTMNVDVSLFPFSIFVSLTVNFQPCGDLTLISEVIFNQLDADEMSCLHLGSLALLLLAACLWSQQHGVWRLQVSSHLLAAAPKAH